MAYISFQPKDHYKYHYYLGNSTTNAQTGFDFQPDIVLIKLLDEPGSSWNYHNSLSGASKWIELDTNSGQETSGSGLASFDSAGFTLTGSSNPWNYGIVGNYYEYNSYSWKAATTTVPTGGTITPTSARINTTSGMSLIEYGGNSTGNQTFPHGLGSAPTMVWIKKINAADNWCVYHKSMTAMKWLDLNDNAAQGDNSDKWEDTDPTSTLVSIGDSGVLNTSGSTYQAYCFAPKKGFSDFGWYRGNANADGTFVHTGFRPSFVFIREYESAEGWVSWNPSDAAAGSSHREGNVLDKMQYINTNGSTNSDNKIDFLSNGFKLRSNHGHLNDGMYIYGAWAEFPFVASDATPGTAR